MSAPDIDPADALDDAAATTLLLLSPGLDGWDRERIEHWLGASPPEPLLIALALTSPAAAWWLSDPARPRPAGPWGFATLAAPNRLAHALADAALRERLVAWLRSAPDPELLVRVAQTRADVQRLLAAETPIAGPVSRADSQLFSLLSSPWGTSGARALLPQSPHLAPAAVTALLAEALGWLRTNARGGESEAVETIDGLAAGGHLDPGEVLRLADASTYPIRPVGWTLLLRAPVLAADPALRARALAGADQGTLERLLMTAPTPDEARRAGTALLALAPDAVRRAFSAPTPPPWLEHLPRPVVASLLASATGRAERERIARRLDRLR